jgi:ribose/xylose/arabinose/galactoside ABC-type transport system permease subunit
MSRLKTWEGGLLVVFLLTLALNVAFAPEFLTVQNQINLFQLSIEKIIVALVMTLVILNAEIDLSVASVMGLSAAAFGFLVNAGWGGGTAILVCLHDRAGRRGCERRAVGAARHPLAGGDAGDADRLSRAGAGAGAR